MRIKRWLVAVAAMAIVLLPAQAQASFPWSDTPGSTGSCVPWYAPVVCQQITGTGTLVNSDSGSFHGYPGQNVSGRFYILMGGPNGPIWKQSPIQSWYQIGTQMHAYKFNLGVYLPDGTELCMKWQFDDDHIPCATIHS